MDTCGLALVGRRWLGRGWGYPAERWTRLAASCDTLAKPGLCSKRTVGTVFAGPGDGVYLMAVAACMLGEPDTGLMPD